MCLKLLLLKGQYFEISKVTSIEIFSKYGASRLKIPIDQHPTIVTITQKLIIYYVDNKLSIYTCTLFL